MPCPLLQVARAHRASERRCGPDTGGAGMGGGLQRRGWARHPLLETVERVREGANERTASESRFRGLAQTHCRSANVSSNRLVAANTARAELHARDQTDDGGGRCRLSPAPLQPSAPTRAALDNVEIKTNVSAPVHGDGVPSNSKEAAFGATLLEQDRSSWPMTEC